MYLFDKKDNNIEVYSMDPNMEKIYDFRKNEMEKIPENERLLKFVSNNPKDWSEFYNGIINIENEYLSKKKFLNSYYCNLEQYSTTKEEKEKQKQFLEEYYKSNNHHYRIKINEDSKAIKRLLINNKWILDKKNTFIMNDIILVPESILLLEFLLSYDFQLLKEEDIREQLKLFDFSKEPIESISFSKIRKYIDLGIFSHQTAFELNLKVEHSKKILQYIKK